MAMMDNKDFLISHIRNSFVTSDDTGMCEMIIDLEDNDKQSDKNWGSAADSGLESSDNELSHSYDILPDMDFGAHRRRSNTAQRLERMKKEKRQQSKVKNITWKDSGIDFNPDDRALLFEKKDLSPVRQQMQHRSTLSLLTEQLDSSANMGDNPFLEYAKFDGKASVGVSTKKIDIFLTMALPEDRPYPMTVVVIATAKIQDLIGLICWQYTTEMREPMLHENKGMYCLYIAEDDREVDTDFPSLDIKEPVSKFGFTNLPNPHENTGMYCLHIAEDDGEVDTDFPSLDSKEPVSKFGFTKLALVEKDMPTQSSKASNIVTINIPNRGFNKFQVENLNITMRELLQKVLKRRKVKVRPGQAYNLEKQGDADVPVDLDATLSSMDTLEFCLVRENSSRGDSVCFDDSNSAIADSLTSHQYKSYMVNMVHKLRTNTEVQLGVSGEKVEIDPVASKSSTRLFRQRAVTHDADSIASCDKLEDKDGGKSLFRLTYFSNHDYKHHDFEADTEVCQEIVHKINNILELRISPVRKEYVAHRSKKLLKKRDSLKFS